MPIVLSHCYNSLLTPAGMISNLPNYMYDDPVKAVIPQGFVVNIHVDVVQNHDLMSWHVPYYPVLSCSGDAHIFFDDANSLREYFHNVGLFCGPLMNSSLSSELLCCPSSCYSYNQNALRFLWDVNDSVVPHGILANPLSCVFCTCASTYVLHYCSKSTLDVIIQLVSFYLSYIYDCLLFMISTDKTSNLDIKSESVLSFYGSDPTK